MWDVDTSLILQLFAAQGNISVQNWTNWEVAEGIDEEGWSWERLDPEGWYEFQETYWWLPFILIVGYVLSVHILKEWMKTRSPVTHSYFIKILLFHNFVVSFYSAVFLWRTSPRLISALADQKDNWFYHLACERTPLTRKDVFWLITFCWSKVLHLMDTYFLVLKKKPVPFFHLYHHAVVVFIPMTIVSYGEPILYLFGLLNVTQHVITYPILLAKVLKLQLCSATSTFLLGLELMQMAVGFFLGGYTLYVIRSGGICLRHPTSLAFMNFIFASLGLLVIKLLLEKIFRVQRKQKEN